MTVQSLMQMCAGLGIKLRLAGDDHSRLQVDAPKGTLTPFIREELATHKLDLVVALKAMRKVEIQASEGEATNSSTDNVAREPPLGRANPDLQKSISSAN